MSRLVSVVIPCYNPTHFLEETLASVRAQTHRPVEIVLVDDGTDRPESREIVRKAAAAADRVVEQENRGLAAARNAGFQAAGGEYVLPLDADDRLRPRAISECLAALEAHPEAAFAYPDYLVFGEVRYVERTPEYNLYRLLGENTLIYAALIRRADWEAAGGYDERMRLGYEDWDFWLRLGERGRYGRHVGKVLFEYRKHGRSLLTAAREHHEELVAHIRDNHPALYSREGQVRVKREWSPAVCVLGPAPEDQTIEDWAQGPAAERRAAAFLRPPASGGLDRHAAEWCALAVWGGRAPVRLPDGSEALPRPAGRAPEPGRRSPARVFGRLHRHLINAELEWRHPVRSAARLIPLRVKERVNRWAGRPLFDLRFYLRFQPQSVLTGAALAEPLRYLTRPAGGRRRIALVTPHLGPGGAETVLLEAAGALERERCEIFLITTQSTDDRWRPRWERAADHVYDLGALAAPERMTAALYSMALNWEFDAVVVQNALAAYAAIPHWKRALPRLRIADLVHAVDPAWDVVRASAAVAWGIDVRVAVSQAVVERLRAGGTPEGKIRLIRNGIDLARFRPPEADEGSRDVVFAGRLDPVKRPLLLVDIAAQLARLRKRPDFRFVVAGDGPEEAALRRRIRRARLESAFELAGHVEDMPALLARAAAVVLPSRAEGIPLAALEAMAMERPVVSARAGAAAEVVRPDTGMLIEPGPGEARRFAEALDRLLDDAALRRTLGRAGRALVESGYRRDRMLADYRALFAELL